MDNSMITLIASISAIILSMLLVALVKVIVTFANKNMIESFNISKGFVRKSDLVEFKNEVKKTMAIEQITLQQLLMQQLDQMLDNKIKEFRNVGNKLITIDETINALNLLKDEFKDKISSFNLIDDKVSSLGKEFNKIRYGTDSPSEEDITRRKG